MTSAKSIMGMLLAGLLLATTWLTVQAGANDYVDNNKDNYIDNAGNNFGKGKTFFLSNVFPKLADNGCFNCHARGYVRPNVQRYEEMIRRLAIGDSAENNAVIYKIANVRSISPEIPNHPGGQNCATINAEPCKTIRQWWEIEFGQESADK